MKRKKILKSIFIIIQVILFITVLYNLFSYFTKGKLKINVKTSNTYYVGSNIDVLVDVSKSKTDKPVDSKVKLELYNNDGKKIKNAKAFAKIDKNNQENISINLPENLDKGKYDLKITASSGIFKDSLEIPVNILQGHKSKTIISLDKGIYKPGDQINYRALILSNKEYTPEQQEVSIFIYDGNENKVYSETTNSSEYGIVSGSFKLGDEVNSGTYKITVSNKSQEFSKEFKVNPYITPKFEAEILTDKENYIVGEDAQITISSKYFFGEPVAQANIKGKINDEEVVGITNNEGNFVTTYNVKETGKLKLNFEVTDTSNYAVETSKTVVCGTNIFEIEILPEYGNIVSGIDNTIYIITKTAGGKPVKTYSDISLSQINKQVITDENGIGSFILTSSEIASLKLENNSINIVCKDMDNNEVKKNENIYILSNNGALVKTDKVKYQAGDDINVSLETSNNLNNNVIYVYKNNELLKILSSDSNEFTFNLEDITGLIDIYTPANNKNNYKKYYYTDVLSDNYESNLSNYNKKTIFIKPNKTLNINVATDAEQYKPGENLNIKFSTTDENNQSVDSALLVSILDEAILNLAENDLSIDNVKLALQDIELTDGMTAADLYANVIDDSSDATLNALMLKQSYTEPNIISKSYVNYDLDEYCMRAIIIGIIFIIIILVYLEIKFKKLRKFTIPIINVIVISIIILVYIDVFLGYTLDFPIIINFLTAFVIAVVTYVLILYKEKDYIFKLLVELIFIPGTFLVITAVFRGIVYVIMSYEYSQILDYVQIILGLIVILIFAITKVKSRERKLGKFELILQKYTSILVKAFVFWIATIVVAGMFEELAFLIVLAVYIIFDRIIFKKHKEKPIKEGKIVLQINGIDAISILMGIIMIILIIVFIMNVYERVQDTVNYPMEAIVNDSMGAIDYNSSFEGSASTPNSFKDIDIDSAFSSSASDSTSSSITFGSDTTNPATTSKNNTIFGNNTFASIIEDEDIKDTLENEVIDSVEKESQIEENVRNVFLESLAFIPELLTENGKAETNLKISDNITTWNIQTIGNTKNGNIGYNSKSFKVFKEFFVDFSLPNNCVVTDKVSIPVTLYNYTDGDLTIEINVVKNDWSNIGEYSKAVNIKAKSTSMIYVPLEIIKQGENTLRIETKAGNISDIVEKTMKVSFNGLEKQEVVSSGTIDKKYEQDMIFDNEALNGSKKVKIKLYSAPISQIIEGIENIFKMPTGCFEQTSSSLYPDILVLKYLKSNDLSNEEIENKALGYISAGYQKLLTYEVPGEKGGYSLYGNSPAEPVITAFGLMEFKELSEVYTVDENVINNMTEYLFKNQKSNGTFNYDSTYIGSASNTDKFAMNAYIVWALSEVCPEDTRLEKSINYFERNLGKITDNYTLALIANIFANTDNKELAKDIIKEITNELNISGESAYISSNVYDYYGTSGKYQNIQTTALTSIALSKLNMDNKNNNLLIDYLISSKNPYGTWGTTQATILSLKAINDYSLNSDISNQTIIIKFNDREEKIDIDKNTLDYYEFEFDNVSKENKFSIDMKKGKFTYEVIKEYYEEYSKIENKSNISVTQTIDTNVKVNDIINQKITINNTQNEIANGLIQLSIPQGSTPIEETLLKLKYDGKIEKYEYNYGKINLYVRNLKINDTLNFDIQYKALYPTEITGASVRFFDYYNPNIECISSPVMINVTE